MIIKNKIIKIIMMHIIIINIINKNINNSTINTIGSRNNCNVQPSFIISNDHLKYMLY